MSEPLARTFATETGVIAYKVLEAQTAGEAPTLVLLHKSPPTVRILPGAAASAWWRNCSSSLA